MQPNKNSRQACKVHNVKGSAFPNSHSTYPLSFLAGVWHVLAVGSRVGVLLGVHGGGETHAPLLRGVWHTKHSLPGGGGSSLLERGREQNKQGLWM